MCLIFRLTPALAVIVLFNATLYRHMGNGPLWGMVESDVDNCRDYWWSALLYIQNYVNPEKMVCYFVISFSVFYLINWVFSVWGSLGTCRWIPSYSFCPP